jgi:hypothetical protein
MDSCDCLELLRKEVKRLGRVAEMRSKDEQEDVRSARLNVQRLNMTLDKIVRLTRWLPEKSDVASLAAKYSRGIEPSNTGSAIQQIVRAIALLQDLREWVPSLRQLKTARPPPSHSDPLARHFVALMVDMYRRYRKKEPPRGRTGPFASFLAAAWTDLKFPVPKAEDGKSKDIITWLGQKAEKAPRLTKQYYDQKR